MRFVHIDLFKTWVANIAHHEKREHTQTNEHNPFDAVHKGMFTVEQNPHGNNNRRRRDGNADKNRRLGDTNHNVKTSQPNRAKHDIHRAHQRTQFPIHMPHAEVKQHGWCYAKSDNVRQRVKLSAKFTRRIGHTSNSSIQSIKNKREQNINGGFFKLSIGGSNNTNHP